MGSDAVATLCSAPWAYVKATVGNWLQESSEGYEKWLEVCGLLRSVPTWVRGGQCLDVEGIGTVQRLAS